MDEECPLLAAYRAIYLANDPTAYAELSLALARLGMTPADWAAVRAPVLVASGAHDFLWPPALWTLSPAPERAARPE